MVSSDHVGLLGTIVAMWTGLATASLLGRWIGLDVKVNRFTSVDGLRGYAAIFVYFCHAAAWYYYARNGKWGVMPLKVYGAFGAASVSIFFMITAFLFTSKLLERRQSPIDWLRMLVSRVLRLVPGYILSMLALFAVVVVISGATIHEAPHILASSVVSWLAFTIFGAPDLNGVKDTWLVIAGVTWSLPYEIAFYCTLPLMYVAIGGTAALQMVAVSSIIALALAVTRPDPTLALPFAAGSLAAWLTRKQAARDFCRTDLAGAIALAAVALAVTLFWRIFGIIPQLLLAIAFFIVAGGNSCFGLLVSRSARLLGEVSYGMYLLHAILLFVMIQWIVGLNQLQGMSAWWYWGCIVLLTPLVVIACVISFVLVERPALRRVDHVTDCIRRKIASVRALERP